MGIVFSRRRSIPANPFGAAGIEVNSETGRNSLTLKAFIANVFFIPMSVKLKRRSEQQTRNMKLILEGVLAIQGGENPNLLRNKLLVHLGISEKKMKQKK